MHLFEFYDVTIDNVIKMHNVCCAFGCKARLRERINLSFFRIPTDQRRREIRINALGFVPSKNARVCGKHFISGKALARACTNVSQTDVQDGIFS